MRSRPRLRRHLGAFAGLLSILFLAPVQASASNAPAWRVLAGTTSSVRYYMQPGCSGIFRCWVPFDGPEGGQVGVLATVNGGKTWTTERLPGHAASLAGISCTGPSDCWLVGYSGSLATKSQGVAMRTVNGGKSWVVLALPPELGLGVQHQLFAIACRGPNWCTAVGGGSLPPGPTTSSACGPGCSSVRVGGPGSGLLALTTSNGGSSWKVTAVPIPSGAQLNALSCGAVGACQAVGFGFTNCRPAGKGRTCGAAGAAARSGEGGSWASDTTGTGIFNLYGVSCPTPAQCWATGSTGNDVQGSGVVLHTTDGGARWARQAPAAGSNSLTSISCPSVEYCSAIGGMGTASHVTPVVEVSHNGGANWSTEALPAGLSQAVLITCPVPGYCLGTATQGYGRGEDSVLLANWAA